MASISIVKSGFGRITLVDGSKLILRVAIVNVSKQPGSSPFGGVNLAVKTTGGVAIEELPEEFREVELELYRLARRSGEVLVTILDFNKHRAVVVDIMKKLEIEDLPTLVVSEKRIDLRNPDKKGTTVIRRGALKRLAEQGRIGELISNIPVWASLGELKDKVKLEAELKSLFGKLWNEVKQLISINI